MSISASRTLDDSHYNYKRRALKKAVRRFFKPANPEPAVDFVSKKCIQLFMSWFIFTRFNTTDYLELKCDTIVSHNEA